MRWHMVVFPAIGRLRKVDLQFEASLGYTVKAGQKGGGEGERRRMRRGRGRGKPTCKPHLWIPPSNQLS